MNSDKLYVIIIIGMIGIFIYWYQTRLDLETQTNKTNNATHDVYCTGCSRRMIKRKDKSKNHNHMKQTNKQVSLAHAETQPNKQGSREATSKNPNQNKVSDKHIKKSIKSKSIKSKSIKSKSVKSKEEDSYDSDDSIPDSIIEARLNSKSKMKSNSSKNGKKDKLDEESEISIESLDTLDRSDASNSRRDNDILDMVDGTIDSDGDTIDLD